MKKSRAYETKSILLPFLPFLKGVGGVVATTAVPFRIFGPVASASFKSLPHQPAQTGYESPLFSATPTCPPLVRQPSQQGLGRSFV